MSLKTTLLETIKRLNGQMLTLDEFEAICKRQKRKTSNGERRMREATDVVAVRNSKGYIIGYRWKIPIALYQTKLTVNNPPCSLKQSTLL